MNDLRPEKEGTARVFAVRQRILLSITDDLYEIGLMFLGYDCAISRKSEIKITEIFRKSEFHRWTGCDIYRIAEAFNPKIRGWINYYGKFRMHKLMRIFRIFHWRLIKWAVKRYGRFGGSMHKQDDGSGILRIAILGYLSTGSMASMALNLLCNKIRMMREYHVRFRERLGGKFPRPTRPSVTGL